MRSIEKLDEPEVLATNSGQWLEEFKSDSKSTSKRYRYRHPEIKERLKVESGWKCVYCESKIGHNTPGDVEHKTPSSKNIDLHFTWGNLTVACTECNRRKNAYDDPSMPFLDPHSDFIEGMVEHYGPLVTWVTGNSRAEVSLKLLNLNDHQRQELVIRKYQALADFFNLIERYESAPNPTLKGLLLNEIHEKVGIHHEYSGMLYDVACKKGLVSPCTSRPDAQRKN